jgi:hypothetical protein
MTAKFRFTQEGQWIGPLDDVSALTQDDIVRTTPLLAESSPFAMWMYNLLTENSWCTATWSDSDTTPATWTTGAIQQEPKETTSQTSTKAARVVTRSL